jgi:hypothetical protein
MDRVAGMDGKTEAKTQEQGKRRFDWRGVVLGLLLFVVLYGLSAGPFVMLVDKGRISNHNEFLMAFYSPWDRVYRTRLLHKPMGLYLRWWAPRRYDENGNRK